MVLQNSHIKYRLSFNISLLLCSFLGNPMLFSQNVDIQKDTLVSFSQDVEKDGAEHTFDLDLSLLSQRYRNAPLDSDQNGTPLLITLPDELGNLMEFNLWESPVISDEMAKMYPDFKTYTITSIDGTKATGRIFLSRFGLEGMVMRAGRTIKYEPFDKRKPSGHRSYIIPTETSLICGIDHENETIRKLGKRFAPQAMSNGSIRRTYELALVATGEFYIKSNLGNNSMPLAQATLVNIVNLLNVRYNVEMAINFTIFSTPVIYTDTLTDPFMPWVRNTLTTQASNAINTSYNSGGYDLGHVIHAEATGGAGVAGLNVVCSSGSSKARGWSGGSDINTIAISIMIHEIGHMFGGNHTFNGSGKNCTSGNISNNSSIEIGSGSTIMSYAGSCQSNNNIQSNSDNYFHSFSIQSFLSYLASTGGTCSTNTATGNTPPTVMANPCNTN